MIDTNFSIVVSLLCLFLIFSSWGNSVLVVYEFSVKTLAFLDFVCAFYSKQLIAVVFHRGCCEGQREFWSFCRGRCKGVQSGGGSS